MLVMTSLLDGAVAAAVGVKDVMPYMLKFVTGTLDVWGSRTSSSRRTRSRPSWHSPVP